MWAELAYNLINNSGLEQLALARRRINAHWRDSGRIPRFFVMDARAFFPLLFFLMHITWWTFIVAAVVACFFGALEHYGYTTMVFLRALRTFLAGKVKVVRPWWRKERFR